jgi:predicted dehydrogenase
MLNCALIGPGRMGQMYTQILNEHSEVKLVAICGHSRENTEKLKSFFDIPIYYNNDWLGMYEEHPEIDTVCISTSDWSHKNPVLDAIAHQKNIILEKPMASSLQEAKEMLEKATEAKIKMGLCHVLRFDTRYLQAKKALENGNFGTVGYIVSRRNANRSSAQRVQGKIPMAFWLTSHDIDLMRWFLDSEVVEVYAVASDFDLKGDFLHVLLKFANGSRGLIEISWFGPVLHGQQHSLFDIEAEHGRIEVDVNKSGVKVFRAEQGIEIPDTSDFVNVDGIHKGTLQNMLDEFINAFNKGSEPRVNAIDGLISVAICDAIHRSVHSNKTISVDMEALGL